MLGEGATQLVKNAAAAAEQLAQVRALFDTMGVTVVFEQERMLNEVIPYAGSARPTFICLPTRWCRARSGTHFRGRCAYPVLPDHDRLGQDDAAAGQKRLRS